MSHSVEEYRRTLIHFAERVPELLSRHATTAKLAYRIRELELLQQLERRFTLALVGRIKSGKSTLVNALIGRRLAPMGVVETTATVNYIDHGEADLTGVFDVHWREQDSAIERLPMVEVKRFLGKNNDLAERVSHLRFYAANDWLHKVRIIDTVGAGSTDDAHERNALGFVEAGRADAIVLVLPPKQRELESQMLDMFGASTRLPGQGPYNTIGVIQKWETETPRGDPIEEIRQRAAIFQERMQGRVSIVVPVSGLLALAAQDVPVEALHRLARLACASAGDAVELLRLGEEGFVDEIDGAADSPAARAELLAVIKAGMAKGDAGSEATWAFVRFALDLARRRGTDDGPSLQALLKKTSGLDELKRLLEERFFAHAGLIQAGSVLSKALEPCRSAAVSFKEELERRQELQREAERLRTSLSQHVGLPATLAGTMRNYIDATLVMLRNEVEPIRATWRELDDLSKEARYDFELLERDLEMLRRLDAANPALFTPARELELRHLLGHYGLDVATRLGIRRDAEAALLQDRATALDIELAREASRSPEAQRRILEHARARLSRLLDVLEATAADMAGTV